jgi:hypothetical protein
MARIEEGGSKEQEESAALMLDEIACSIAPRMLKAALGKAC